MKEEYEPVTVEQFKVKVFYSDVSISYDNEKDALRTMLKLSKGLPRKVVGISQWLNNQLVTFDLYQNGVYTETPTRD